MNEFVNAYVESKLSVQEYNCERESCGIFYLNDETSDTYNDGIPDLKVFVKTVIAKTPTTSSHVSTCASKRL